MRWIKYYHKNAPLYYYLKGCCGGNLWHDSLQCCKTASVLSRISNNQRPENCSQVIKYTFQILVRTCCTNICSSSIPEIVRLYVSLFDCLSDCCPNNVMNVILMNAISYNMIMLSIVIEPGRNLAILISIQFAIW